MNFKFDALIVLGRGISPTGELPNSVKGCIKKAAELYQDHIAPHIILSGKWYRHYDFVPPTTEAKAMSKLATELGVPPSAIFLEEDSLDTISNFYYIKTQILMPHQWHNVLLLVIPQNEGRPTYLMHKILGPDFLCETADVDFAFPTEKQADLLISERDKLAKLKEFLHNVEDGDHETIFKMHNDYIQNNS